METTDKKDKTRLEGELCLCLQNAIDTANRVQIQTLLVVGVRLNGIPFSALEHLSKLEPHSVVVAAELKNRRQAGRAGKILRIGRPWTAEVAYKLSYGTSDYPDVQYLAVSACRGWALAQHDLGVLLENGSGVEKNQGLAVEWYRLAAESGDSFAQNDLGVCLAKGRGIPFDGKAAVKWYRKSARQGCVEGMINYASCLLCGCCVERDKTAAYRLALRSYLKSSSGKAAYIVGLCVQNGWGTRADPELAKDWRKIASSLGVTNKNAGWKGCAPGSLPRFKAAPCHS